MEVIKLSAGVYFVHALHVLWFMTVAPIYSSIGVNSSKCYILSKAYYLYTYSKVTNVTDYTLFINNKVLHCMANEIMEKWQ